VFSFLPYFPVIIIVNATKINNPDAFRLTFLPENNNEKKKKKIEKIFSSRNEHFVRYDVFTKLYGLVFLSLLHCLLFVANLGNEIFIHLLLKKKYK